MLVRICIFALIINISLNTTDAQIPLVINELMASNSNTQPDPQGEYDDWIEIYNHGTSAVDMSSMYLTDDLSNPTKWQLPATTTIPADGYILIWTDGDTTDPGLHANFKLSAGGEEIGLFDTDGITPIDSVTFSKQIADISYGRYPDASDDWRFSDLPSPTEQNNDGYLGIVADTKFSHDRGFYDTPFEVEISTETSGAIIFYTTDGSTPTETYGRFYTSPILISTTTCLRAMAFKQDFRSTNVDTQTYIFLEDVIQQTGEGFPNPWGHLGADYEMDPVVVDAYRDTIIDDLKSIPIMSLVMSEDDWFNGSSNTATGGIYANPGWNDDYDDEAERAVSVEFFDPSGDLGEFQINAGVRIAGGSSARGSNWKSDKLSMRLKFQEQYGPTKLRYPLFGEGADDSFDTLVLDARLNNVWNYGNNNGQRERAQYTRDQFTSDIQNALGGYGHHGFHVHLYLNGLYWGLYNLHERPDESFAASYLGGNKEDYDVIKHNPVTIVNGSGTNYREMFNIANAGLSSDSQYQLIQEYLDVPDFINYMITNFFVGNTDWDRHNWYASRNIADPNGRWRYHSWDAEHVMKSLGENVTGRNNDDGPTQLHQRLTANAEYRMLFADHVHRHFFNDGSLTVENVTALYQHRLDEVDRAVVGESARWGDNRIEQAGIRYTRNQHWVAERDWFLNTYFPNRTDVVLDQLTARSLYPNVDAPVFLINDVYQYGGQIETGDILSMTSSTGTIYYTLDGSDPLGTAMISQPDTYTDLVKEDFAKKILVPTGSISDDWKTEFAFNDSAWISGSGGVGYENSSGYEALIDLDIAAQMPNSNTSCYIRIPFIIMENPDNFDFLMLNIQYDDGFIAYINGTEVQRAIFTGTPTWNSQADDNHEAQGVESFVISNHLDSLRLGQNLLAIHGLNVSLTSSDFIIAAELIAGINDDSDEDIITPGVFQYTGPITLNDSVNIKARALAGNIWSALNEATYTNGPVEENQ